MPAELYQHPLYMSPNNAFLGNCYHQLNPHKINYQTIQYPKNNLILSD